MMTSPPCFIPTPPTRPRVQLPQGPSVQDSGFWSRPNAWRIQISTTSRGIPRSDSSSRRTANPAISPLDGTQPWKPTPVTSSTTTHGKLLSLIMTGCRVTSQPRATRGLLSSTPRAKWSPSFTPECPEDYIQPRHFRHPARLAFVSFLFCLYHSEKTRCRTRRPLCIYVRSRYRN